VDSTHGKDFVLTNYARNLIQVKARQLCRRREFLPADQADLQQELWLMLCERVDAFDPAKASLDTFIDRVVNTAVGVILRNRQRLKRNTGGPVVSLDDSGNDPTRPTSSARPASCGCGTTAASRCPGSPSWRCRNRSSAQRPTCRSSRTRSTSRAARRTNWSRTQLVKRMAEGITGVLHESCVPSLAGW
jgi:hypothetical protein